MQVNAAKASGPSMIGWFAPPPFFFYLLLNGMPATVQFSNK